MAEKQSLYEILGLSDKASREDVQRAFDESRQALESETDEEEKRNRRAILQHAHDILNDRRQRAGYDRRSRDRRLAEALKASSPARSLRPVIGILLVAGAACLAWLYIADDKPALNAPTRAFSAPPAARKIEPPAISKDIATLLPQAPAVAVPGSTTPAPPPVAPQSTQKLVFEGPNAAALAKFSDSTYLIIGAEGLGTGVVIDHDKLLTNCHVIAPNVLKGPILAINPATREKTRITEAAFLIREDACVVHAPGLNGKPIAIGDAGRLARGARIFNIGFANGRLIASAGALLGVINRGGQNYLVSSNYCDQGVSGGPLVDEEGRLVGLTSGGPPDRSFCLSLTAETARTVLTQTLIAIDAFPPSYLSNLARRW
ncbi:MAG: trypsin-like peptidase domain-containing protein [Rhodocyclales bacterium]|nr:trypsin-like peptidase domain-containing protein [Rhodocyclales bacterium]